MSDDEAAARGVEIASRAVVAMCDQSPRGVLDALNEATHAEALYAAAYLVSMVGECARLIDKKHPAKGLAQVRRAASDPAEDALVASVELLIQKEARRLNHG